MENKCPDCNQGPHDVTYLTHIFNCTSNPTNFSPTKLWTRPREVAKFLELTVVEVEEQ